MSQGSQPTDSPTHLEIMMFLDGELSGDEAKVVARHLEESKEGAVIAASLGEVSELVRTSVELEADAAEDKLAGLWAGIDDALMSSKASNGVHADAVLSFQDAAEAKATDKLVQQAGWFGGWQSHVTIGVLAAAAAFVIMYKSQGTQASSQQTQTAQNAPAHSTNPPQIVPVVLRSQEPIVEELEVYNGSAVIMTVPGDTKNEPASAVIWISSDTDVTPESI